jgi:hypothetical protein
MDINILNYNILKRNEEKMEGKIIKHEVETIDFMIDNKSLLKLIVNQHGGHNDYMGCFSKDWNKLNEHSGNILLLRKEPDTKIKHIAIYVCPECADINCGAYCCKVEKTDELYVWKDFTYENDYEPEIIVDNIGPFYFNKKEYERIIMDIIKKFV